MSPKKIKIYNKKDKNIWRKQKKIVLYRYGLIYLDRNSRKGRYKDLKITDVRVRMVTKDDAKLKAVASITIDECFVVHDIKIINGKDGLFISMPSRKTPEGEYKDIVHPINTETRELIRTAIMAEYDKVSVGE